MEYTTRDFYISSVLRSVGFSLLSLHKENGNFVTFIFSDPQNKIPQTISEYWDKKIQVDARTLIEAINELKTRVHSKV